MYNFLNTLDKPAVFLDNKQNKKTTTID